MGLETEHRGYRIRYSENGDEWTCFDIGNGKGAVAPTLSAMKAKVDKYLLGIRKEAAVPCLAVETYGRLKITEATITEYVGPKVERPSSYSGEGRRGPYISSQRIAAMALRSGNDRVSRQEQALENFAPIGPATDAAIAEAMRCQKIKDEAEAAFKAAVAAIPRLTLNDISELVRVSGIDPTGGINPSEGA